MVVFSNRRLGPSAELLVSQEVAGEVLREVAASARPRAQARWEHELVQWLEQCATSHGPASQGAGAAAGAGAGGSTALDVSEIAWTPEHFERQRRFLIEAIQRAQTGSRHGRALERWSGMIEAHPRESVQVGRRWQWPPKELTV